jgi:Uma2 family endonuclease
MILRIWKSIQNTRKEDFIMGDMTRKKIYTETDYENWPGDERVELINGQILMMAPPSTIHQRISAFISNVLSYRARARNCNRFGTSLYFAVVR